MLKVKFSLPTQLSIFFQVQSKFIALAVPYLPNIYCWTSNNLNINHWCFWEEGILIFSHWNAINLLQLWWPSWISDQHKKNIFVEGHTRNILAMFDFKWPPWIQIHTIKYILCKGQYNDQLCRVCSFWEIIFFINFPKAFYVQQCHTELVIFEISGQHRHKQRTDPIKLHYLLWHSC